MLLLIQIKAEFYCRLVLLHEQDQKLLVGVHCVGVGTVDSTLQFGVLSSEAEPAPFQRPLCRKFLGQGPGSGQIGDTVNTQSLDFFVGGIVM